MRSFYRENPISRHWGELVSTSAATAATKWYLRGDTLPTIRLRLDLREEFGLELPAPSAGLAMAVLANFLGN